MSRLLYPFYRLTGMARCILPSISTLIALAGLALVLPQYAAAEAVTGPESVQGPSGLPDGRVYEEASPANKHGNEALERERPSFVAPDGQAVMYGASGAIAEESSNSVVEPPVLSERTSHGWVTRSVLPLPVTGSQSPEEYVGIGTLATLEVPSADLSHVLFSTFNLEPYVGPPDEPELGNNAYLAGPDPFVEPEWVGRSLIGGSPGGVEGSSFFPAGGSPDLKTIYFFDGGKLFPGASSLYEYKEGVLSDAGVLPGGETSAGRAVPAAQQSRSASQASLISAAGYDNQVSADGSRIFFVREDEKGTLELYARVTASDGSQSTVLVSQSQLPGHVGEAAPNGPVAVPSTERQADTYFIEFGGHETVPSYVFASPDGSHAFFQSTDRLTETAPEDSTAKTYAFDLDTGTLEYLPGMTGSIVTVSNDGSSAVFENTTASPFELERWVSGSGGGSVRPIAKLPEVSPDTCGSVVCVGPAYSTSDGSVVVFSTDTLIPGFNDGGSHYTRQTPFEGEVELPEYGLFPNSEIFRYEAQSDKLSCLSCPPQGVTPSSNAVMSKLDDQFNSATATGGAEVTSSGRAMSVNADTVFFETRDALVPQDTNGTSDVYEWQDGKVYLISSGHSPQPSYFTGTSESGGDVFFMTSEGIAPGDTDGSYDMYDARIPRPGDNPPPGAVPCTGAVCQGPPSVPQLLGQPASEAFDGAGNLTPAPSLPGHPKAKSLTRAQKLERALKACKRQRGASKRKKCEKQARRRYGAKAAGAQRVSKQARHRNGRGK